jgi:hypothetical protein
MSWRPQLAYCEVTGTYEYLMRDQGAFNYLVKAGIGITIGSALLPVFANLAWRSGHRLRAVGIWMSFPLAVTFIFAAAIERTGGVADLTQQGRVSAKLARHLAERTETEATTALDMAMATVKKECDSGQGPKCTKAQEEQAKAQTNVTLARTALQRAPIEQQDAIAERIAALSQGAITPDQVRLYRPILGPMLLALFAGIFLWLGAHMEGPSTSREPWTWLRLPWRRPADVPVVVVTPKVIEPEPDKITRTVRNQPRLVASDPSPTGSVPEIVAETLEPAPEQSVTTFALYRAYEGQCKASGKRPAAPEKLLTDLERFCKGADIKLNKRGKDVRLMDVQLVVSAEQAV